MVKMVGYLWYSFDDIKNAHRLQRIYFLSGLSLRSN